MFDFLFSQISLQKFPKNLLFSFSTIFAHLTIIRIVAKNGSQNYSTLDNLEIIFTFCIRMTEK